MDSFHIITLVVASVSLILVLTIAGILIKKDKGSQKFPTSHKKAPEGWEWKKNANGTRYLKTDGGGKNESKHSTQNSPSVPVAIAEDICIQKMWAQREGVYWDGVTTHNGC